MPPKRSVLCRPPRLLPRLLPHSMRLSRQYTNTDRACPRRHTNTDRARRTDTERSLVSAVYKHRQSPLLCSVFAPSLPPHLVTVSLPLLGAHDPQHS
ncbi:hypothetical protein NDU88_008289 [Pleurodeles waltl]|uniref:Uncharacterized protein n=1 Tax=Pleurodeles waltl TaxID=8319 RepID=A0AAV7NYU1_PLEWA|nr:hypothetical protein NDU88_008289 [Pleurodeles waltl]